MVTQFLGRHLPASGVSANTLKAYRDTIKLMLEFAYGTCGITPVKMSIESFTADFVLRFLTWLIETRKCSPRTRNQRLAGIHSFCKYVQFKSPETLVEIGKIMSIRKMRVLPDLFFNILQISFPQTMEMEQPSFPKRLRHIHSPNNDK